MRPSGTTQGASAPDDPTLPRWRLLWGRAALHIPLEIRGSARVFKRLLLEHGYLRSTRERMSIDRAGAPVPWYTFPAFEYLDQLDFSGRRVFEYGSGNSTRWWLSKGATVVAVENDPEWYERLRPDVEGPTMTYVLAPERDAYVEAIREHPPFDVVVVDGFWRGLCAERAVEHLTDDGLVILDNSDWLPDVAAGLRAAGLTEIDFSGFIPIGDHACTTSLFLRPGASFTPVDVQPRPPRGGVRVPRWRRDLILVDPQTRPD